jgi:hypothetical protein
MVVLKVELTSVWSTTIMMDLSLHTAFKMMN